MWHNESDKSMLSAMYTTVQCNNVSLDVCACLELRKYSLKYATFTDYLSELPHHEIL